MAPMQPTERVDLRQFPGIEDESPFAHTLVKLGKTVSRIGRRMKGHDDRGLHSTVKEGSQAQFAHTFHASAVQFSR